MPRVIVCPAELYHEVAALVRELPVTDGLSILVYDPQATGKRKAHFHAELKSLFNIEP